MNEARNKRQEQRDHARLNYNVGLLRKMTKDERAAKECYVKMHQKGLRALLLFCGLSGKKTGKSLGEISGGCHLSWKNACNLGRSSPVRLEDIDAPPKCCRRKEVMDERECVRDLRGT